MSRLPEDFLAYTPLLRHLSLGKYSDYILSDWTLSTLGQTPHLASLQLGLRHPTENVSELLRQLPQLIHLTVNGLVEPMSEDFLSKLSGLSYLTLAGTFDPCEIPVLQLPPTLKELDMRLVVDGSQVACLADSWLTQDSVMTELSLYLHGLENLETDALPRLPALTRLTVDVGGVTALPPRLLANVPNLIRLHLHRGPESPRYDDPPFNLQGEFLAGTPNLTDFSLELPYRLRDLPAELLDPVPDLKRFRLAGQGLTTLPAGFLDSQSELTDVSIDLCDLKDLPDSILIHTPHLRTLYMGTDPYVCRVGFGKFGPRFLPARFLEYTPQLTHLWLGLKALAQLPPAMLVHVPQLQHVEFAYIYGKDGKQTYAISSVPTHFLENAPELTYLDLWPVVKLDDLPENFLGESSQLKSLSLDANAVSILPNSFLTQTPHLELLKLDAKSTEGLPQGFLAKTPRLSNLMLDVDRAVAIPVGFLSDAPFLRYLDMRAASVTELPEGFLAQSPQLVDLGLGMPNLEDPPSSGDAFWETLKATSKRVKVTDPDFEITVREDNGCIGFDWQVEQGDILEVAGRNLDDEGNTWLTAYVWRTRELFFVFYERHVCPFQIDARYTEPTLDV